MWLTGGWLVVALLACLGRCSSALAGEGVLDPSFGNQGMATFELGFGQSFPFSEFSAIGVAPDGKIYAAGTSGNGGGGFQVLTARVGENGSLDPSFGNGGAVINAPTQPTPILDQYAYALSIEPNDSVVVAGDVIERLTSVGQFDSAFAPNWSPLEIHAVARLRDGDLAAVGYQYTGGEKLEPAAVEVLLPNGAPAPDFGTKGLVLLPYHPGEYCNMKAAGMLEQPNGELLVSGTGNYATSGNEQGHAFLWLAKLTRSGSLDQSFGTGGISFLEGRSGPGWLESRSNGLVLVGYNAGGPEQLTVWGLTGEGAPDPSFGNNGVVQLPILTWTNNAYLSDVTMDPAGRVLVAGRQTNAERPGIVRIKPNGQLDQSFGEAGIAPGPPGAEFAALTVDPAGRILAAGHLVEQPPQGGSHQYSLIERFSAQPAVAPTTRLPGGSPQAPGQLALKRARLAATLARQLDPRACASSIRVLLRRHGCTLVLHLGAHGTIVVDWWTLLRSSHGSRRRTRRLLVASGRATLAARGPTRLRIRLTTNGIKLLRAQRRPLQLTATATLTYLAQPPVHASRRFTLRAR
jgi:uncharacterized delta-60 repeat protein